LYRTSLVIRSWSWWWNEKFTGGYFAIARLFRVYLTLVMDITRRAFLKYCLACSGALGLAPSGVKRLEAALVSDGVPTIIWLHGSGCQGDSISFLNRIDAESPPGQRTVDDILINSVNLAYHTVVMS
jgi:Ni,Fe-hydrogenase I small subunit